MRRASITEAKNGLSALVDRVRAGESVLILDRGTPVARLEPVNQPGRSDGRVLRLERAGIVRSGAVAIDLDALRVPGPTVARHGSAVAALLDDRRATR